MIILLAIGKIFLILLFVFICILAVVLFAPVSYELDLDIDEKRVDVRLNWLLKLVRFRFHMKERMEAVLSILFFRRDFTDPETKKKRAKRKAARQNRKLKKQEKKREKNRRKQRGSYEKRKKTREASGKIDGSDQELIQTVPEEAPTAVFTEDNANCDYAASGAGEGEHAGSGEASGSEDRNAGMKESASKLRDTAGKVLSSAGTLRRILNLVREYEVFSVAWPGLIRFLGRIRPRKMSGHIAFGLDDPAATGQITGAIAMVPLIYETDIRISPDFEADKAYIQGSIYIKGHMQLIHALILILGLVRNKKIRSFIGAVRNRK